MKRDYPYLIASFLTIIFPAIFLLGGVIPEIAMDTIGGLFLLHSCVAKDWQWCRKKWVQCLAILWVYMSLRSLFTPHIGESFSRSIVFVRYFMFSAALAYWTFTGREVQGKFIKVLTAVILFMMGDGLFQYFHGGVDIFGFHDFASQSGSVRLSDTFRKPILGIMTSWLVFPVFLKFLTAGEGTSLQKKNLFMILFLAFLVLGVVSLSGERMALLLMLFGWGLVILLMSGYRMRAMVVLAIGCIAVAGTAVMSPLVMGRQEGSTVHTLTNWWDSPYGMLLKTDLRMAEIDPVFGIGSYEFRTVCPTLYPGMSEDALKGVCNLHPHNIYLEWMIENGAIGLALFLLFLALVSKQCMKHWPEAKNNPLFIGFLIAFILRVWPVASTTGLSSSWGASPMWLVFGCMLACMRVRERDI